MGQQRTRGSNRFVSGLPGKLNWRRRNATRHPAHCPSWKETSMFILTATGLPSFVAGLNFHCPTVLTVSASNSGLNDRTILGSWTLPSTPTTTSTITTPVTLWFLAVWFLAVLGYRGVGVETGLGGLMTALGSGSEFLEPSAACALRCTLGSSAGSITCTSRTVRIEQHHSTTDELRRQVVWRK